MRNQRGYSQQKKVDGYLGLLDDLYSTMLLIYGLTVHLTWIITSLWISFKTVYTSKL